MTITSEIADWQGDFCLVLQLSGQAQLTYIPGFHLLLLLTSLLLLVREICIMPLYLSRFLDSCFGVLVLGNCKPESSHI